MIEERHFRPAGVTGKAAFLFFDKGPQEAKDAFFKPFQHDAFARFGTIFIAPIALACGVVISLVLALIDIVLAVCNLLLLEPTDALGCLKDAGDNFILFPACLILMAFSPIINLVDFIGGVIVTGMDFAEAPGENPPALSV